MTEKPQDIDVLRKRYETLNRKKIENEADLKSQEAQLKKLQEEAVAKFGTHDIAELETKLETMKRENEERRRAYQESLDSIEARLVEVDAEYASSQDAEA